MQLKAGLNKINLKQLFPNFVIGDGAVVTFHANNFNDPPLVLV